MTLKRKRRPGFVLCAVLFLIGCGSTGKETVQESIRPAQVAEENNTPEENRDTAESIENNDILPQFVMLHPKLISTVQTESAPDDNGMFFTLSSADYETVTLNDNEAKKFPALAASLASYAEQQQQEYDDNCRFITDSAKAEYEARKQDGSEFFNGYESSVHAAVTRSDSILLSIREDYYDYMGGMHGMYSSAGVTFDSRTGEKLCAADILKDPDTAAEAVVEKLRIIYPELSPSIKAEELAAEIRASGKGDHTSFGWVMDGSGMTFYFAPYHLGSYADGMQEVLLSYEEYPGIFTEKYAPASTDYIVPMSRYTGTEIALSYPRIPAVVNMFWNTGSYDTFDRRIITIQSMSQEFISDYGVFDWSSYLVKKGDRTFLYSFDCMENDYVLLNIFELTDGNAVQLEYSENMEPVYYNTGTEYPDRNRYKAVKGVISDPENVEFSTRLNVLSTYNGVRSYRINENGIPEARNGFYTVSDLLELTLKKEMAFIMVKEDGSGTEEKRFPAGTVCTIYRTDAKSCIDFIIDGDSSRIGRLLFTAEDRPGNWPQTIGGEDALEIFDGMIFAG